MCDSEYVVTVKTADKQEIETLVISGTTCLLADEGTVFWLQVDNKSACTCAVSVTVGTTYLGTWLAHPMSFVRVETQRDKKLQFRGHFRHLAEHTAGLFSPNGHTSAIITSIVPIENTVMRCVPNNTCLDPKSMQCNKEINWGKQTDIRIPVLLR